MTLLVRYGEIGLKGRPIRRQFENILLGNIHRALSWAGVAHAASKQRGRLFVEADDDDAAMKVLGEVFGIVSLSPAVKTSADLPCIASTAASFATSIRDGQSFAIRATRTGSHNFTSQDVGVAAGQAVVDVTGATVDLGSPDRGIGVEVRDIQAYVFDTTCEGPGGLPYGSQGCVVVAVADEDDLQAAWLMMRRGCTAVFVCRPEMELAIRERLRWRPADIITANGDLLEQAEKLALQRNAQGLVTGNGQYKKCRLPVFYPLLGYREVTA
ncbi:MAG: THUMP domain-containing protein [Thermoplasmatota archaeon]